MKSARRPWLLPGDPVLLLLLTACWCAINGAVDGLTILGGALVAVGALALDRPLRGRRARLHRRRLRLSDLRRVVVLLWRLACDTVKGALQVAWDVVTPTHLSQPAIIAYPLMAHSDVEITLLACMITVTPGTISLEVSPDRRFLYIHALYAPDPAAIPAEIRGRYEIPLLALLRGADEWSVAGGAP